MNNSSGIDHIKSQLFSEGKLFSFEGRANRLQFFIITLFTLPIFFLMSELAPLIFIHDNTPAINAGIFFIFMLLTCSTLGYIFFAAARRRLRDLNIATSTYTHHLILLNVILYILYKVVFYFLYWDTPKQLSDMIAIMTTGIILIDVIILVIMFSIKGVSNANQE
ncbi:hypothetical protein A6B40_08705 [Mannheimia varigena]|nr:hypothetical protein A6B40_08705 [Mannheimia varigena]